MGLVTVAVCDKDEKPDATKYLIQMDDTQRVEVWLCANCAKPLLELMKYGKDSAPPRPASKTDRSMASRIRPPLRST